MAAIFHSVRRRRAAAFAAALLAPAAVHASGLGEALALAFLMFAGLNLVFYGAVVACWWLAAKWRLRRPRLAVALLVLGTLPFVHYAVQAARTWGEPQRRAAELVSLPALPARAGPAHSLLAPNSVDFDRDLRTLVASGAIGELSGPVFNDRTTIYRRREGWDCLDFETAGGSAAEYRRVVLARHAFRSCVTEQPMQPLPQATLVLLVNQSAPHHYTGIACAASTYPHDALELRRPPAQGGTLVAYREAALLQGSAFPPLVTPGARGWVCPRADAEQSNRDRERMEAFPFVAQALGLHSPEDFPRAADPAAVPEALRRLAPLLLKAQYAHDDVLALLGQWPATAETAALVGDGPIAQQASLHLLPRAAELLADPRQAERQRRLYPQLGTHLPALLQACALHQSAADKACAQLGAVAAGRK